MPAVDDNQQTKRGKTIMDLWILTHCSPDLNLRVQRNIINQVCKLRVDEIFVSEHNTAYIKAAAMAAHYKAYVRNEDIQASMPTHMGTLASISLPSSATLRGCQIAWRKASERKGHATLSRVETNMYPKTGVLAFIPCLSEPKPSPGRVIESYTRTNLPVAVVAALEAAKGSSWHENRWSPGAKLAGGALRDG